MENLFNYEISLSGVLSLTQNFFGDVLTCEQINQVSKNAFNLLEQDIKFIASRDPSQNTPQKVKSLKTKSLIATMCYRVANQIFYSDYLSEELKFKLPREFMEMVASKTAIDIHPQAQIAEGFFIDHGVNVVIGSTCVIGKNCNIFNNVVLGSKNVKSSLDKKRHPTLKNGVTICAGVRVLGDVTIGENCFISPQAVVLDDVSDNTHVSVINQLQLSKLGNRLPSQKLIIYGVVPKFKNTIKILGEGFYNPTVLIKLNGGKTLNYFISYWDKNKILIKIKNTTPFSVLDTHNAKIVVLSNSDKVIITQSYGLTKALTTLS